MNTSHRIHLRIPVSVPIEYIEFERFHPDRLLNLSVGGAYVLTPRPLPIKKHFRFKFILPELPNTELQASGSVVWSPADRQGKGGSRHPMGMGVEFDNNDKSFLKILDQYVTVYSGLKSVDSRIGSELPSYVREDLPDPKNEGIDIDPDEL